MHHFRNKTDQTFFIENVARNGLKSLFLGPKSAPFCCKNANLPNRTCFTRIRRPPPHPGSHRKNLFIFTCLFLSLEDGKGWGHNRGDLKMPFSTWKIPENTLIFESINFQAIFMAPHPRKMPEKCLENAWKMPEKPLIQKSGCFQIPPFMPPPFASLFLSWRKGIWKFASDLRSPIPALSVQSCTWRHGCTFQFRRTCKVSSSP